MKRNAQHGDKSAVNGHASVIGKGTNTAVSQSLSGAKNSEVREELVNKLMEKKTKKDRLLRINNSVVIARACAQVARGVNAESASARGSSRRWPAASLMPDATL